MRDLLVSKVRMLGSDGSEDNIRASHDSRGRVYDFKIILERVKSHLLNRETEPQKCMLCAFPKPSFRFSRNISRREIGVSNTAIHGQ
jgi:hypothetical protein